MSNHGIVADIHLGEPALQTPPLLTAGSAMRACWRSKVLNVDPPSNARRVLWFHNEGASGGQELRPWTRVTDAAPSLTARNPRYLDLRHFPQ